jgi:hypothetical protein
MMWLVFLGGHRVLVGNRERVQVKVGDRSPSSLYLMSANCYFGKLYDLHFTTIQKLHLINENYKETYRASREADFLLKLGENNFPIRAPSKET